MEPEYPNCPECQKEMVLAWKTCRYEKGKTVSLDYMFQCKKHGQVLQTHKREAPGLWSSKAGVFLPKA